MKVDQRLILVLPIDSGSKAADLISAVTQSPDLARL